jgi:hypothetical protein
MANPSGHWNINNIDQLPYRAASERFSIPSEELEELHLQGIQARFSELAGHIPVVARLAQNQSIGGIRQLSDAAALLLRNTVYKSYPLSLLEKAQFPALTRWLNGLTTHDLSSVDTSRCETIDDWIMLLDRTTPIRIIHSSGTGGKLSFLPRSTREVAFSVELARSHCDGFGDEPDRGVVDGYEKLPVLYPGYRYGAMESNRLLDGIAERFHGGRQDSIIPANPGRMSADLLSLGGRLRSAADRGERENVGGLDVSKMRALVRKAAEEQADLAKEFSTNIFERYRGQRVVLIGYWWQLYQLSLEGIERGITGIFQPDSLIMCGGGTKGRDMPADYEDRVSAFLGVPKIRDGYGMSECVASVRACPNRNFHLQPWLVPFLLDPKTGEQLPRTGRATGHLGLFDLLPNSYWGGFLTGDEVTLSWSDTPCGCGRQGAYISPDIRRYSESEGGDGKVTCAGAPEAHDDALDFLTNLA